jgi:hypothetical protein
MKQHEDWKNFSSKGVMCVVLVGGFAWMAACVSNSAPAASAPVVAAAPVEIAAKPKPVKVAAVPRHHHRQHRRAAAMTDAGVTAMLAAKGVTCSMEDNPLANGEARRMGKLPGDTTLIELIGDPNNLHSIALESLSPTAGGDPAKLSGAYIGLLLRTYAPHTVNWASDKLLWASARSNGGKAQRRSGGRLVTVSALTWEPNLLTVVSIKHL